MLRELSDRRAQPQVLTNWNGASVPLRIWKGEVAALDESGQNVGLLKNFGPDNNIQLWDVNASQSQKHATNRLHAGSASKNAKSGPRLLAFSPDGQQLAWSLQDSATAIIADVKTGRQSLFAVPKRGKSGLIPPIAVQSLAFSPDGRSLAVVCATIVFILDSNSVTRFQWRRPVSPLPTLPLRVAPAASFASPASTAWSPDGKRLALGLLSTPSPAAIASAPALPFLRIHDAQSGRELHAWPSPSVASAAKGITNLAWSPDGEHLAWGTWDGGAFLMNAQTGAIERQLSIVDSAPKLATPWDLPQFVAYAPDGQTLAVASQDKITLYRVR